jgi:hypothetical protein
VGFSGLAEFLGFGGGCIAKFLGGFHGAGFGGLKGIVTAGGGGEGEVRRGDVAHNRGV